VLANFMHLNYFCLDKKLFMDSQDFGHVYCLVPYFCDINETLTRVGGVHAYGSYIDLQDGGYFV